MKLKCGGLRRLIESKQRNGTVTTGRGLNDALRLTGRKKTVIAIIKKNHRELSRCIGTHEGWAVLCIEPVRWVCSSSQRKVTLISQSPKNISPSISVRVVYLHNPVLMT